MTIESRLREAIRYETSIRDFYLGAARRAGEEESRRFYHFMERDERSHIAFLEAKTAELRISGAITLEGLRSAPIDHVRVEEARRAAARPLAGKDPGGRIESLAKALAEEEETSAFYRGLLGVEDAGAAALFARFLEIEEGHARIVRAELDLASSSGYWFDMKEFDLEE